MKLEKEPFPQKTFIFILILISALAGIVILLSTRWGSWLFSDGVGYIVSTRNLLHGDGLGLWRASGRFVISNTQPPLYSFSLASVSAFGLDLMISARILGVTYFVLLVSLLGYLSYRITRNQILAISVSLFVLSSPYLVDFFSAAMSEGLFFLLLTVGILLLIKAMQTKKIWILVISTLILGLTCVTRYVGIGLIIGAYICLLFWPLSSRRLRLITFTVALPMTILPTAIWYVWLSFQPSSEPIRELSFEVSSLPTKLLSLRASLIDVLWSSVPFHSDSLSLTYRRRFFILIILATILLIAILIPFFIKKRGRTIDTSGLRICLVFLVFAFTFLMAISGAYLLSFPQPDFNLRTASPAIFLLTLSGFNGIVWSIFTLRERWWSVLGFSMIVIFVLGNILASTSIAVELNRDGRGYTGRAWRESETLEQVRNLDQLSTIITNNSAVILLYYNHPAYEISGEDDANLQRLVHEPGASLVIFNINQSRSDHESDIRWIDDYQFLTKDLRQEYLGADGAIFVASN